MAWWETKAHQEASDAYGKAWADFVDKKLVELEGDRLMEAILKQMELLAKEYGLDIHTGAL